MGCSVRCSSACRGCLWSFPPDGGCDASPSGFSSVLPTAGLGRWPSLDIFSIAWKNTVGVAEMMTVDEGKLSASAEETKDASFYVLPSTVTVSRNVLVSLAFEPCFRARYRPPWVGLVVDHDSFACVLGLNALRSL